MTKLVLIGEADGRRFYTHPSNFTEVQYLPDEGFALVRLKEGAMPIELKSASDAPLVTVEREELEGLHPDFAQP